MGKELKRKREQKAKIKFKQTKTLFKGQNETDTNFKVRKIAIKEQLKQNDQNQPLSSRKLNIKDLISRLNHYSSPAKIDALAGIQELLTNNFEEIIQIHISPLINNSLNLLLDKENRIRVQTLKVIKIIFKKLEESQINPHIQTILSFLNCSMTHINPSIQEDSLLFVDILLNSLPNLMSINANKILPNFLNMISKLNPDVETKRNLTLNLGQKITSIHWRVQVFCRLYKLLETMALTKDEELISASEKIFQFKNVRYISLYLPVCDSDSLLFSLLEHENVDDFYSEKLNNIKSFIDLLLPLLFESWIEVKNSLNSDKSISEESTLLLNIILNILYFLWNFLCKLEKEYHFNILTNWFRKKYEPEIRNHFLPMFPFSDQKHKPINSSIKELLTNFNIKTDDHNRTSNLLIIYLYGSLQQGCHVDISTKILKYLENGLKFYSPHPNKFNILFLECLRKILLDRMIFWNKRSINFGSFLTSLVDFYIKTHNEQIFYILCEIAFIRESPAHKCPAFIDWIKQLPEHLCSSSLTLKASKYINKLATMNNQILVKTLKENKQKIIDYNLKNRHDSDVKNIINNILYLQSR